MSAAYVGRQIPLYHEGTHFWTELTKACLTQMEAMNDVAALHGIDSQKLLRCSCGSSIQMCKRGLPSTDVQVRLSFEAWGPVLLAETTGTQVSGTKFPAIDLVIPIGRDLDGSVVAISEEGRSFSPQDLARLLTQSFRRCYPTVALPC